MQSISVAGDGILYLFKCIALFNGSALYLPLYLLGLIFIAVKGDREMKRFFLWPGAVILLTVYNPLLPLVINRFFDVNKEYYRFMWITPVCIEIAFLSVCYCMRSDKSRGWRIISFIGIILLLMGAGTFIYDEGYTPKENVYKIPNEVIAVSKMIRNNTDMKYPVAVMDRDMQMEIRQYDATILLACDRTQYLDFLAGTEQDELTEEKNEYVDRLLSVIAKYEDIDKDSFREALNKTNTQFVVVEKISPMLKYLSDAGLTSVGTTGTRVIYKFELDDPLYFELADYSRME
ncbi:MAG: hypothetical protein K5668_10885 [Lachnospiraceae bacterium]|nr:hypothetical protein [Lachnospiraceae bacterium]